MMTSKGSIMHIFIVALSWLIQNMNNSDEKPTKMLIVFYSRYGNTARMAEEIAPLFFQKQKPYDHYYFP